MYDQYGALSIGWIVAFALAGYVVILHRRINAIYKEYVQFATNAADKLIPVLGKHTEVMNTVVTQQNEIADNVAALLKAQGPAVGKLDLVVAYILRAKPHHPTEGK